MYRIFFIHSFVGGHLDCFHVLPIMNSAAMNIGLHISFQIIFCLGICPGVGLLDHVAILVFGFGGPSIVFPMVDVPIYIPTNSVRGFPSPAFIIGILLIVAILTCVRWHLIMVLICIPLVISNDEHFFMRASFFFNRLFLRSLSQTLWLLEDFSETNKVVQGVERK